MNNSSAILCVSATSALSEHRRRLGLALLATFLIALAPGVAWPQEGRTPEFGFAYKGPGQAIGSIAPMDEIDAADASNLLDRRTEAAIVRALNYLKQSQGGDGRWNGEDANWVAYNAFAMIAYMLNGHFPGTKQPYGPTMSKALDAILEEAGSDGYLGTSMYAHGLATLCLSEMWGHTNKDGQVQKALKAAVDVILRSQSELGGWRYDPVPGGADVSITAMQVIALAAARQAGIFVPDSTINRAVRYVELCHHAESGGFTYVAGMGDPGFARTAAATFSLMMLGKHGVPEVKSGVNYMSKLKLKAMQTTDHYMYGHYYAALVMYQAGSTEFERWYPGIRDILLARQSAEGSFVTGSTKIIYDTAIATIILSIPYGYMPAYQR